MHDLLVNTRRGRHHVLWKFCGRQLLKNLLSPLLNTLSQNILFVSGECQASAAYIDQLQEVFDYNVPNKVAGFFAEPIQVHFEHIKIFKVEIKFLSKG